MTRPIAAGVAVAALAAAAPAQAAFVSVGPASVEYTAEAGTDAANVDGPSVTFLPIGEGGKYQFQQGGTAVMKPIAPCESSSGNTVVCPVSAPRTVVVQLRDGDDFVNGNNHPIRADGGSGDDALAGGSGNDLLTDPSGTNSFVANYGNDVVIGGTGRDAIDGTDGNDVLLGGNGDDTLQGSRGNDSLDGGGENDRLDGDEGADTFIAEPGADAYIGDEGQDTLSYAAATGPVAVSVGTGVGNDGRAGEGDSVGSRVETIVGSAGHDTLIGGAADVDLTLRGGPGEDRLTGGPRADVLDGGPGADLMSASPGRDTFSGGSESDAVSYEETAGEVVADIDGQADDGTRAEGDNVLTDVEILAGGRGDDRLSGSSRPETIIGNDGDDVLLGLGGRDSLRGEDGRDLLRSIDSSRDSDDCGPGRDRVEPDAGDIQIQCEAIDYRGEPGPIVIPPDSSLFPTFVLPPEPLSRSGFVTIQLGCAGGRCEGALAIRTVRPVDTRGFGARSAARRRVRLGRRSFRIRAGRRRVIRIRLSRPARRLARRSRRVRVTATVRAGRGRRIRRARARFAIRAARTRRAR